MEKFMTKFNTFCDNAFESFIKWFRKYLLLIVLICITILALTARVLVSDYLSGDMLGFLLKWFDYFKNNGNITALGTISQGPYNDYLPGYNILLAIMSYFPGKPILLIKIISFIFDIALGVGVGLIVYHFSKNKYASLVSYTITLFLPTVFANSALWGQCDQIYTCFAVFALYLLIKNKQTWASLLIGISFCFKIQTIFFVPLLAFMWLNKKYRLYNLLFIILGFFITCLPCYIFGAPITFPIDQLTKQFGAYPNLNYCSGSMYAFLWMPEDRFFFNNGASLVIAAAILLFVMFILFYKKVECNDKNMLFVAALYTILMPFVLPHMHERYFFMADIFILLYVLVNKKHIVLAPLMIFSSFNSYIPFLSQCFNEFDPSLNIRPGSYYLINFLRGYDTFILSACINFAIILVLILQIKKLSKNAENSIQNNNV